MTSSSLDPRLNAFRPDLADIALEGQVEAERFVEAIVAHISVPVAPLRRRPDFAASVESELLFGEEVRVFERAGGWAWLQSSFDGYTGYVDETMLAVASPSSTHVVCVPRTFAYPHAELKSPHLMALSLASELAVTGFAETRGTRYAELKTGGFVIAAHIRPAGEPDADYVTVAEQLLLTPYLWGGTSAFGLDCSGLIQLAMRMTGRVVLRDSDMQEAAIGEVIDPAAGLKRGDLVFWKGHVAIFTDPDTVIHANGNTMQVSREPLRDAIRRIAPAYGDPTLYRRPRSDQ